MAPGMVNGSPLAALAPITWEAVDAENIDSFLDETFSAAQVIIDSIPHAAAAAMTATTAATKLSSGATRARSQTDGAVSYTPHSSPAAMHYSKSSSELERQQRDLWQSWKEVRVSSANPRNISVFKMNGGRDGYAGSSWFARRSIHRKETRRGDSGAGGADSADIDIAFDMFKHGLLKEFAVPENGAEGGGGGANNNNNNNNNNNKKTDTKGKQPPAVRTMEIKRRVEHTVVEGAEDDGQGRRTGDCRGAVVSRELSVYLLEADFPGPTSPRDYVTMLLTSQSSSAAHDKQNGRPALRQFMLVSKPCRHPETPPRPGYVRAQYESVEVIREVPVPADRFPVDGSATDERRTRSSIDLSTNATSESPMASNGAHGGHTAGKSFGADGRPEVAVEWLMVTRNNPGGNVPRFLVDRSTPSSIVSDANKFLDWLVKQEFEPETAKTVDG